MFNLFPKKKSVDELVDSVGPFDVYRPVQTPSYLQAQQELSNNLLKENIKLKDQLKSIEEDGTEEHNNAIKLREENVELKKILIDLKEENAQLKIDIHGWKKGVEAWRTQYDQEVAKNTKLEDEIHEYKKGNKNWMNLYQEVVDKNNELLKEIKHLSYLKEKNVELIDRVNEIDSDQNEEYRAEVFRLRNDNAVWKAKYGTLLEKYNGTVTKGGLKYMEAKLQIVQNNYKKCASERDEYKHQLNAANKEIEALKGKVRDWEDKYVRNFSYRDMDKLQKEIDEYKTSFERMKRACEQEAKSANSELVKRIELEKEYEVRLKELNNGLVDVTRENKKFCKIIEDQKAEIEKLKKDIIDYVFEKDEEKSQYPIHWGGWDKVEQPKKVWSTTKVALRDAIEEKQREEAKPCPCNKCKEHRQVSYDLEQRINKLENQVKEIKLLKDYVKGNHRI